MAASASVLLFRTCSPHLESPADILVPLLLRKGVQLCYDAFMVLLDSQPFAALPGLHLVRCCPDSTTVLLVSDFLPRIGRRNDLGVLLVLDFGAPVRGDLLVEAACNSVHGDMAVRASVGDSPRAMVAVSRRSQWFLCRSEVRALHQYRRSRPNR